MSTATRTTTIGSRLTTKSLNVSPARLAMMMFGGSPMSVAVPPMLEAKTSASRKGTGGTPRRWQTSSVTGATSSTVVTLSSTAEATAVITMRVTITRNGRARARFTAQMARYSNTPVRCMTPTMIIMPRSRKTTSQSTPVSGLWKASSNVTTPAASISPAPARATLTRWTFSEAIRT